MKILDGDLMTLTDAATVLGLSVAMVKKLRNKGRLPTVRTVGGVHLYLTKDVRALAERRSKAPKMKDGRIAFGALG